MVLLDLPTFAAVLRRHRLDAGWTQEELAERAGLSARAISDLERGVKQAPRRDTVTLLATALALAPRDRTTFEEAARRRPHGPVGGYATPSISPRPPGGEGRVHSSPTGPIVGRLHELAALDHHLAGAGPPVLVFAGEPGIGKSCLLREAARRAPGYGLRVLEGGCQRRGGQEPYAPLLDALERHLRRLAPAHQHAALRGCAWLVRLLPELATGPRALTPPAALPPAQERRLMFAAVGRFLANVAGPSGALLVLDDLQWADPDALDLLTTLVRGPDAPLRVVGAYRDTDVHPHDPLAGALADLAQGGLSTQRMLGPLGAEEVRTLLAVLLDGVDGAEQAVRERVLERAGGVPFFVVSYAQGLRQGAEGTMSPATPAVPWTVAQGLRQRVAALPWTAQDVLGAAAVAGRHVPRTVLLAVVTASEDAALTALEAACHAHLLEEDGTEGYRFAHDVIREVVEADLGAARRALLHRRIAAALEQDTGEQQVELLAYHYARSDAHDEAARYLERAGDRAQALAAHTAAQGYYRELADRLEGRGRPRAAAAACEKLGVVLTTAAHYDAALDVLEEAAGMYRAAGNGEGMRRVVAQIGHVHASRATPEDGIARLEPVLAAVEAASDEASSGVAALYAVLARLLFMTGRYGEQLAAAERAADMARAAGDDRVLAEAEGRRGSALGMLGRVAESLLVLEGVVDLADVVGDLPSLCHALNNLGATYLESGQIARSMPYFARGLALAERLGDPVQIAWQTCACGEVHFYLGEWDRARVLLERAVALARRVGTSWGTAYPLLELGHLYLATGAWEEATRCLEECLSGSRELQSRRQAQRLLAERDVLAGRPEAVHPRLVPLLDRPDGEEWDVTRFLPILAWSYLELGDDCRAAEVAAQAVRRTRAEDYGVALVDALRVQGLTAIRQRRWAEAERSLEEGLARARGMPYPYAEARLLDVYGALHVEKGEAGPARRRLEAALAIFQRLGAIKDAERVGRALSARDS